MRPDEIIKTLERAGGVTSLGSALTGSLPGVITSASSGMPGAEDPQIIIRTQSSWNNSEPLILVDGIEREMSSVDISSVENISVLKDASATAVYGVKGANGVILITTKRGKEGKASVQIKANVTAKVASKLPEKYDAYDTLLNARLVLILMAGMTILRLPLLISIVILPMRKNGIVILILIGKKHCLIVQPCLTIPVSMFPEVQKLSVILQRLIL